MQTIRLKRWIPLLLIATSVAGCAHKKPQSGAAWKEPEPEYKDHYEPIQGPVELKAVEPPPPGKAGEILGEWLVCEKDSDCTSVETECCGFVAVNRDYWKNARGALPYSVCDMLCPTNIQTFCNEGRCEVVPP